MVTGDQPTKTDFSGVVLNWRLQFGYHKEAEILATESISTQNSMHEQYYRNSKDQVQRLIYPGCQINVPLMAFFPAVY
jgi:hypothetical protein